MILLDTNVISETMKRRVDPVVAAFIDGQRIDELFLPSLVAAEIRYGLRRLPAGRRRDTIEADFAKIGHRRFIVNARKMRLHESTTESLVNGSEAEFILLAMYDAP